MALDYAATQATGINLHATRGELSEVLPYADLADQAKTLGGRLLAIGLEPGDHVAIAAESDGDFLRLFFACQYANLVPAPVPLPAPFGGKEAYVEHVGRMFAAAKVRAAFAPGALAEWFAEAAQDQAMVFRGALANLPTTRAEDLPPSRTEGLSYLQFSSGSTRFPMGVAVTQRALMTNLSAIGNGLQLTPEDRAVTWLPLYHDMGLVGMLLSGLAFQVSIDMLPTGAFVRRPGLWLDLISKRGATISYAPTFGYELAARRAGATTLDGLDLSKWRVAGIGGDMIRPEPLRAFAKAYASVNFDPSAFLACYGMAEATLALTLSPCGLGLKTDTIDVTQLEVRGVARAASGPGGRAREFAVCGVVLPGHWLEVRGPDGAILGERQVGRIFARGPSLMQSYFGEPAETAKTLSADGWLDTGDLGYWLGDQIVITGRAKDLIIVNGRNIWPQDLEWTAENDIDGLRAGDVAVFSTQDDLGEERVIALIQCRTKDQEVRDALAKDVANLLRSRHGLEVEVTPTPPHSLPQTSSGKLSRSKAKALYLAGAFSR